MCGKDLSLITSPRLRAGAYSTGYVLFMCFFLKRLVKLIGGGGSSTPSVPIYKDLEGSNFVPKYKDLKG
jgi:hypothetical protein